MWKFVPEGERAAVKATAFECLSDVTDDDGRIHLTQGDPSTPWVSAADG